MDWETTAVTNLYDKSGADILREGGYYCGIQFQNPKVKMLV